MKEKLTQVMKQKTQAQWCEVMEGTDVCFAPVLSFVDAPTHPANIARNTYIEVDDGWVYLAVVMDLFSRRIIGWAMDEEMKVDLVLEAFNMATSKRNVAPGLILHSDRGVQYRALEYRQALESREIQPSMSRKGNCWDNAAMESFFSRLKVEYVYATRYATLNEAYSSVFEYIEVFYNRVRRHSAIDYRSPANYEQQ